MSNYLTQRQFVRMAAKAKDDQEVRDEITLHIEDDPTSVLPIIDNLVPYFSVTYIRELLGKVIDTQDPKKYLRYMPEIGRYMVDPEKTRAHLLKYHGENPWYFYCYRDQLKDFFGTGYFEDLLAQGIDFTKDPDLFAIFRLFYGDVPYDAQSTSIKTKLRELLPEAKMDVTVLEAREPGFACGGLEANYLQALKEGRGLCNVNDFFLAKKFHRKGEAKKVTLVPRSTARNRQKTAIWKDHVYAPSQGTHQAIEEALEEGQNRVTIPHVAIRPVRPLIKLNSASLFRAFDESKKE